MAEFTSGKSLNIMAFNADGITGQVHELESILYERNIDILLLNETHLSEFKITLPIEMIEKMLLKEELRYA